MFPNHDLISATASPQIMCANVGCTGLQTAQIPSTPLTEARMCDWIASARIGETIQYHEGFLLTDRAESSSTLSAKARTTLHAVARRAWNACELGLVHLYSIRIAECQYRYLAVRSSSTLQPAEIRARLRNTERRAEPKSPNRNVQ